MTRSCAFILEARHSEETRDYAPHNASRETGSTPCRRWNPQLSDFGHPKSAGFVSKLTRAARAAPPPFKVVHSLDHRSLNALSRRSKLAGCNGGRFLSLSFFLPPPPSSSFLLQKPAAIVSGCRARCREGGSRKKKKAKVFVLPFPPSPLLIKAKGKCLCPKEVSVCALFCGVKKTPHTLAYGCTFGSSGGVSGGGGEGVKRRRRR